MPFYRVAEINIKLCWSVLKKNAEKCVDFVKNTLDYVEISTVTKLMIKSEKQWNEKHFKDFKDPQFKLNRIHIIFANFNLCLIFLWYLLTGVSSFTQFFHSILAHVVCRTTYVLVASNQAVSMEVVSRFFGQVRLECLVVKTWLWTKWHVFLAANLLLLWNNFSV